MNTICTMCCLRHANVVYSCHACALFVAGTSVVNAHVPVEVSGLGEAQ